MTEQNSSSFHAITLEPTKVITEDSDGAISPKQPGSLHRSSSYNATITSHNNEPEEQSKEDPWESRFKDRKGMYKRLASFFLMLVITVGLPLALYYSTRNTIGALYALLLSGAPPLLHTIYVFIRRRSLDIFGLLMVVAFVVSAVISIVTGDVRAALLRDSAVTALVSILFFVTLIPIKNKWISNRPLTYTIASQMLFDNAPPYHWIDKYGQRHELPISDWVWSMPKTRKLHHINTAGWSIGLMCEFIIRVIMVEATSLTTDQIILYGNVVVIVVVVTMTSFGIFVSVSTRNEIRQWVKDNNYALRKEPSRTDSQPAHDNA